MTSYTVLDAKEASQIVFRGKVGPNKLLKMGKRKEIPMFKVGGRYLFSQEDLQKYIEASFGKTENAAGKIEDKDGLGSV